MQEYEGKKMISHPREKVSCLQACHAGDSPSRLSAPAPSGKGPENLKLPSQRRKTSSGGFTGPQSILNSSAPLSEGGGPRSGRGSVGGRNNHVNRLHSAKAEQGTIFDVRRFSTHDGAGIRTTVFFKGCPLQCKWCHNPEGIAAARRPLFFEKRCIGCQLCKTAARAAGELVGAERRSEGDVLVRSIPYRAGDAENTTLWERIIETCPSGALAWDSRTVTSAALADELLRDLPFFRHGGGVTLSGGEPLLQPAFAADVLARAQAAGVHTAIETALAVPEKNLRVVLPHLDHVFADCKIFDRTAHIAATGVPNDIILANLRMLLRGARTADFPTVTIRTPLIPQFTATDGNIAAIARFLASENPAIHYELLNYNPLAAAKYHLVGRAYCFDENPQKYTKEEMHHFVAIAQNAGLSNVTVDE